MMRLVKNELIKLWKQTGYRVAFFILLGLALLFSLLTIVIEGEEDVYESPESYLEDCVYADEYGYKASDLGIVYYDSMVEATEFFIKNDITDWRFKAYISDYEELYLEVVAARLIAEGDFSADEISGWPFYYESEYSSESAETTYQEYAKKLGELQKEILQMTAQEYLKSALENDKLNLEYAKAEYEKAEFSYNADPYNENRKYDLRYAKVYLEVSQKLYEAMEHIYNESCSPVDWQYQSAYWCMGSAASMVLESIPVTEKEFNSDENLHIQTMYSSYKHYVESSNDSLAYYSEAIDTYLHSIKNDTPLPMLRDSSKYVFRLSIESTVDFMSIFFIVIAAGIVAREFSSGTIRLLLIRPRSRTKIIVSKILALLITYAITLVGSALIIFALTVMICGVGDLFVNDIVYLGGTIIEIPSVISTLGNFLVCSLPIFLGMSVAFVLAAATKKNGLATSISIIGVYLGSGIVEVIMAVINQFGYAPWLKYTPLPYASLTSFEPSAAHSYYLYGTQLINGELWIGILYHIAFIGIFTYLAILAFKKMQVKS